MIDPDNFSLYTLKQAFIVLTSTEIQLQWEFSCAKSFVMKCDCVRLRSGLRRSLQKHTKTQTNCWKWITKYRGDGWIRCNRRDCIWGEYISSHENNLTNWSYWHRHIYSHVSIGCFNLRSFVVRLKITRPFLVRINLKCTRICELATRCVVVHIQIWLAGLAARQRLVTVSLIKKYMRYQ